MHKLSSAFHRDGATQQEADQYRLLVTAGPSYNQRDHQVVPVNTDTPVVVENAFMTTKIAVRVRGYRGLPSSSPASSPYFADAIHEHDQYSLEFSFVPKKDIPSVNTVWGNDFDHPIRNRLPPPFLINTAFKIVKNFIDPGLEIDAYADEPWVYGPSLSSWFALRVGDEVAQGKDFPAPCSEPALQDGATASGQKIRDALRLPADNEERRKFFLDARNRESFVFEKDRCYQGDFYNPFIDFGNFSLKLPGFSLKVIKYVGGKTHCLRYVFKDRSTGDVFFNVNFHLLWGTQLEEALQADKEDQSNLGGHGESRLKWVVCKPAAEGVPDASATKDVLHDEPPQEDARQETSRPQESRPEDARPGASDVSEHQEPLMADSSNVANEDIHQEVNIGSDDDAEQSMDAMH